MKKLIIYFRPVIAILLFSLICGCINIDYTGQRYPAIKSQSEIAFYNNSKEVPANEYVVIGRAVATAPDSYKSKNIKQKLLDRAQECGADAIQVVDFKRIFISQQVVPSPSDYDNGPSGSWANRGTRADGSKIAVDDSGKVVQLQENVHDRYELKARVLFLRLKSKNPVQGPIVEKTPEPEVKTVETPAPVKNNNAKNIKPAVK